MRALKNVNVQLWVLQVFLALFFGGASGAPKLFLPVEMLGMPILLPTTFVQLIGVAEVLGALGLLLPGLTRVRPDLTPLAAFGLMLVALCAIVYQLLAGQPESAVFALGMALLAGLAAYGRWRIAPHQGKVLAPSL